MKVLTKSDVCLIIFFIIFAIKFNFMLSDKLEVIDIDTAKVIVSIDNNLPREYDLNTDSEHTIEIDGNINTIRIKDSSVKMVSANCNDGLCVYQSKISYGNESIVCLPHKLIVTIENVEDSEIDSLVQ